jgi:GGDEF domain-containing protein
MPGLVGAEEKTVGTDSGNQAVGQEPDAVTGFGTRDALLRDVTEAVAPSSAPQTLAMLDLRGYYNAYGQFEGDSLVRRVAGLLPQVLEGARFYRPRATEIAVLVPSSPEEAEQRLAEAAATLTARFAQARIVIGFGTAQLPGEARDAGLALRIADSRHFLRMRTPRDRRLVPRTK